MPSAISSVPSQNSASYQQFALPLLFAAFGLIMGSWAGRIPALRDGIQVSHSALSAVLVCGGIGAVMSFPISAKLMMVLGARKTLLVSGLALLVVLMAIGLAPSMPLLMLAVLMLGITASCYDVAVNSAATAVEKASGRSALARLHAWGCGGGLAGALLGSLMASMKIAPAQHFVMVAVPLGFVLWLGYGLLDEAASSHVAEKKTLSLPRGPLVLLGAIGFLGSMAEGSIADWSGVFLKDHFAVSDGFAPLALTAFSSMMLLTRIYGDRMKMRHGARLLVAAGAVLGAAGICLAVFAPGAQVALGGFAVAGVGLALVFPFVFSAAGTQGPMALAGVATMAYSGTLTGPPVIGAVAHFLGLQAAMGLVAVLSLAIGVIASRSVLLK